MMRWVWPTPHYRKPEVLVGVVMILILLLQPLVSSLRPAMGSLDFAYTSPRTATQAPPLTSDGMVEVAAPVSTATGTAQPAGVSAVAWQNMMQAVRLGSYQPVWQTPANGAAAFYAPNRRHNLLSAFTTTGVQIQPRQSSMGPTALGEAADWQINLRPLRYGAGDGLLALPTVAQAVDTAERRVDYTWSADLTEWYINDEDGLEHGFTVHQRPNDALGLLTVEMALATDLTPVLEDGDLLAFYDAAGLRVLEYRGLYVYDATGRELAAALSLTTHAAAAPDRGFLSDNVFWATDAGRHQLRITVDDESAQYPLTIDPTFVDPVKKLEGVGNGGAVGDVFGVSVAVDGDTIVVGAYLDDVGSNANQGSAYVFGRNQGGTDNWGQVTQLIAADGAGEGRFGSSVAVDGDTIVVGMPGDDGRRGSAYVFGRNQGGSDNWGQVTKLADANGAAEDRFGWSVAVDGDTIVVGALWDDGRRGSAYVYGRNQGGSDNWGQVTKLADANGADGDFFGHSVAVDGDTIVVGMPGDDGSRGSAYVFGRNQGGPDNWEQVTKLAAGDGAVDDWFGISVAVDGDTIVAGAYGDDLFRGSAYVFGRNQGGTDNWGQVTQLIADDGAAEDQFGSSVAVDGDTIVVGAWGYDGFRGSAYVFGRNQGGTDNWGQVTQLFAADGAGEDWFGYSVAVDEDTIVVGAPVDDVGSNASQGSAYVFGRNQDGNWTQATKLIALDPGAADDQFGYSVAVDGDTIVVGAFLDDVGSNADQGSAYVFGRNQGGTDNWGQVTQLIAADGAGEDRFGISVAVDGDTIVVGAYVDDVGSNANQGSAYVFGRNEGGTDNWGQVTQLIADDGARLDQFGWSVAVDVDTIVVGVLGDDGRRGSAYVFERNRGGTGNWGQVTQLTADDGAAEDWFGYSVAVDGDTIVVGAVGDDVDGKADQGSVYVFGRDQGGTWTQTKQLTANDGADFDAFGYSVAVDGDTIVVGMPGDDGSRGSAYVFGRNQDGPDNWGQVTKLADANGAASDNFGWSVAVDGDTIVIGVPGDDVGSNDDQGSVYVLGRNQGSTNNWGQVTQFTANDGDAADLFGSLVAVDGDTIVVGATGDDVDNNENQGSAYVFRVTQTPDLIDLSLTKAVAVSSATPGDPITYTLSFSNTQAGVAANVTISDALPAAVTVNQVISSTVGDGVVITQTSGAPNFAWAVSPLGLGAGGVITLTGVVKTDAPAGEVSNTATIAADGEDATPANNSGTAVFTVVPAPVPVLAVVKTADSTEVDEGGPVAYTVVVANTGTGSATDVTVRDSLTGTLAAGVTLAAGQQVTYTYSLTAVDGPDTLVNTATVTSAQGLTATDTVTVSVLNVAPQVAAGSALTVTTSAVVNVNAAFVDPGSTDTFTATIDWGDGQTTPGQVSGNSVNGSHVYAVGSYTVTVTVFDDDGGVGSDSFTVTVLPMRVYLPFVANGALLVYANEFSNAPSDEWSSRVITTSPSGEAFLGAFEAQTVTLSLADLPAHQTVTVRFDLYVIGSWDGNQVDFPFGTIGPDRWTLLAGENVLLDTTFANFGSFRQAYPDSYPGGDNPTQSGAKAVNTLGYTFDGEEMDAIYQIEVTFQHTADSLDLNFRSGNTENALDESWGVDNISVMLGN